MTHTSRCSLNETEKYSPRQDVQLCSAVTDRSHGLNRLRGILGLLPDRQRRSTMVNNGPTCRAPRSLTDLYYLYIEQFHCCVILISDICLWVRFARKVIVGTTVGEFAHGNDGKRIGSSITMLSNQFHVMYRDVLSFPLRSDR